ncbi:MAG: alcohol dehydrogenase catalytic domain-containing protein, partial [Peptococcaceae bacterium]|nr:alcohol dehydrogenase catalytic domain-containing protein [Peptococcaceae bacterium]
MRAMVLEAPGRPLRLSEVPVPEPGPGQVLLRVRACGLCRTDLHIVDGELKEPRLPLIPGHQIVGTVMAAGPGADRFAMGDRVGVP